MTVFHRFQGRVYAVPLRPPPSERDDCFLESLWCGEKEREKPQMSEQMTSVLLWEQWRYREKREERDNISFSFTRVTADLGFFSQKDGATFG